jgi:hypothetical protein
MGNDQISVEIPPGWTDTTGTSGPTETLLLQLNEPAAYGANNVVFQLHSDLGPRPGSSSRHELDIDAANLTNRAYAGYWTIIGSITDCSVGGEKASFAAFSHGNTIEYRIYVLHHPDQRYPLLYIVIIVGQGGVDEKAMLDAKRLMGSWNWGQ